PLLQVAARNDEGFTQLRLSKRERPVTLDDETEKQITWKNKVLHGKYPKILNSAIIDKEESLKWLNKVNLHPETEGFIIAIQDSIKHTFNYEKYILKQSVVDVVEKCASPNETIDYITAGCPVFSNNAYLCRHNQMAKLIHSQLALKHQLIEKLLYWDRLIVTDKTVDFIRPDILFIDKKSKCGKIIDIACPLSSNIEKTEMDKKRKYENLSIEVKLI
ncbi:hypothetical protein BDFB_013004, partial [Asbolus verrucosus]